jgi:predicted transcriptional regulator
LIYKNFVNLLILEYLGVSQLDIQKDSRSNKSQYFKIENKRNIRNDILDLLKQSEYGLNVSEIAEKLGISRNTVKSYLAQFEKENLIIIKEMGRAKICLLKSTTDSADTSKFISRLPQFFTNFLAALEKVSLSYFPDIQDFIKQIGRAMAQTTFWPTGQRILIPETYKNEKQITIEQLTKIALQFIDLINEFGKLFHIEIDSTQKNDQASSTIFKVSNIAPDLEFSESLYQIWAGILEAKLQETFGDKIYLVIREFQKDLSCCFFELGIKK